jgi:hypothetical protein
MERKQQASAYIQENRAEILASMPDHDDATLERAAIIIQEAIV